MIKSEAQREIYILRAGLLVCQAPALGSPPHSSWKLKLLPGMVETGSPNRETFSTCQLVLGKASFLFYGRDELGGVPSSFPACFSPRGQPLLLCLSRMDGAVRAVRSSLVLPGMV